MSGKVLKGPWGRRSPQVKFWEPLWEELCKTAELPTHAQEEVIAELVGEIQELNGRLKLSPIRMPAGWLRGFVKQAEPDLWPPMHSQDWNKVLFLLKERKKQLQKKQRRELSLISGPQIRRIRWLLNRDPYRDEAWLYAYIGEHFPQASRNKGGRQQPSLSSLTTREAGHVIDLLQGQEPAQGRRRRRA